MLPEKAVKCRVKSPQSVREMIGDQERVTLRRFRPSAENFGSKYYLTFEAALIGFSAQPKTPMVRISAIVNAVAK